LNDLTQKYALNYEVANGVPTLSGEVDTTEDVQTVRKQALALAPNTVLNVYARSEMARAATAVIAGYGFPVKVTSVQDGVLSAEGWAPSEEEWQRVLVDLSHDVPGVNKFNASILFLSSIQESIGEDLRRNGLIDVQVTLDNDTLRCTGILPSDKKTAWQECMAKWQKQYNVIRTVKDETVLTASETPEKPTAEEMKITSIVLSALPCFKTPTGESYYEGSVLPDGHVVESIGTTSVLLRRGDVVKEISVFGSSATAANGLAAGGANGS
jgi:type III secretion system YscD/HrpQ family protein